MDSVIGYHSGHFSQSTGSDGFTRFYSPEFGKEVVKIAPGEIYCSKKNELILTGLGSCVSVCVWDSRLRFGGLNHFLLPNCAHVDHWQRSEQLSVESRYGLHAMELLINSMLKMGSLKSDLVFKLFGGGTFSSNGYCVGERNKAFISEFVDTEQLTVINRDLGGHVARRLVFDPQTGRALIKKIDMELLQQTVALERYYQQQLDTELVTEAAQQRVELF
ncbi:chemotaxis protein CheD [Vibrio proteolyticus]